MYREKDDLMAHIREDDTKTDTKTDAKRKDKGRRKLRDAVAWAALLEASPTRQRAFDAIVEAIDEGVI